MPFLNTSRIERTGWHLKIKQAGGGRTIVSDTELYVVAGSYQCNSVEEQGLFTWLNMRLGVVPAFGTCAGTYALPGTVPYSM